MFGNSVVAGYIIEIDPNIQHKIEEWVELFLKEQKRQREICREKFRKEVEDKEMRKRNEVRKVMSLPPIGVAW